MVKSPPCPMGECSLPHDSKGHPKDIAEYSKGKFRKRSVSFSTFPGENESVYRTASILADFRSVWGRNSKFLKSILRKDLLPQLLLCKALKKTMKTSYTNKHDRGFYILNDMGRNISDLVNE